MAARGRSCVRAGLLLQLLLLIGILASSAVAHKPLAPGRPRSPPKPPPSPPLPSKPPCPTCMKTLLVLGDSYSDAGLPAGEWAYDNSTVPLQSLGYYQGRFTNGPVWSEVICQVENVTLASFAVGPATVLPSIGMPVNATLGGMLAAALSYLAQGNATTRSQTTAVIMLGMNDMLNAPVNASTLVAKIANATQALLNAGVPTVVLANAPDLSDTPYMLALNGTQAYLEVKAAVSLFNSSTQAAVAALNKANPNATVILWDFLSWNRQAVYSGMTYAFKNVSSPCMQSSGGLYNASATLVAVCKPPDNSPQNYLFWDVINPSEGGHRYYAKSFGDLMRKYRLMQ